MSELHLKVAQGPYIAGFDLPHLLVTQLKKRFTTMLTQAVKAGAELPDITLKSRHELLDHPSHAARQMVALYGFWLSIDMTTDNQVVQVYFFRKSRAVIRLSFTEQLQIEFIGHEKNFGRLNTVLMFCLQLWFKQQGQLMTHGSAFGKNDRAFILFGQRGIGKTQLSLQLLHQDWCYCADDKFILHQGQINRIQNNLLLRDYHFAALPWLTGLIPPQKKSFFGPSARAMVRHGVHRLVNEKWLPNEDRLLNKGRQYAVTQLFPDLPVIDQTRPDTLVILSYGSHFHSRQISKEQAIAQIVLLQQLANAEFNPLEDFLVLNKAIKPFTLSDILTRQLPDIPCILLTVPVDTDAEQLSRELTQCLLSQ